MVIGDLEGGEGSILWEREDIAHIVCEKREEDGKPLEVILGRKGRALHRRFPHWEATHHERQRGRLAVQTILKELRPHEKGGKRTTREKGGNRKAFR